MKKSLHLVLHGFDLLPILLVNFIDHFLVVFPLAHQLDLKVFLNFIDSSLSLLTFKPSAPQSLISEFSEFSLIVHQNRLKLQHFLGILFLYGDSLSAEIEYLLVLDIHHRLQLRYFLQQLIHLIILPVRIKDFFGVESLLQ